MQTAALVLTKNCCLLSSSCRKIMPPPSSFSSRQPDRFLCTGNQRLAVPGLVAIGGRNRPHCRLVRAGVLRWPRPWPLGERQHLSRDENWQWQSPEMALVISVVGSDCAASSPAVQQIGVFHHTRGGSHKAQFGENL